MLDITSLTVGYGPEPVLDVLDLAVGSGGAVLVCGAGASGKSTLMHAAAGVVPRLVHAARFEGGVALGGDSIAALPRHRLFARVGVMFQNLDDQLWDLEVEDVIAAPLENRGLPRADIRSRLAELMTGLSLQGLAGRRVLTLSGGERRMVVLAAALAARPELLVLDEPTTGLDPAARQRLVAALLSARDGARMILAADQDAASLAGAVDRIHLLQHGRLDPGRATADALRLATPWLDAGLKPPLRRIAARRPAPPAGRPVLAIDGLSTALRRSPGGVPVLADIALRISAGERVGLVGRNGAGKSTLVQTVIGLQAARTGRITIEGEDASGWTPARRARRIGYLPQNMRRMLFNLTLREEAVFAITGGSRQGATPAILAAADAALARYGLGDKAEDSPFALSEREQALLGLACIEAMGSALAILDEPLLARDLLGRQMLDGFLDRSAAAGRAVLLISHDLELVDDVCERLLILADGRIAEDGPVAAGWTSAAFRELGWPAPSVPVAEDA